MMVHESVTERVAQGDSFDMTWTPSRPGNWLFHCHMFQHMIPPVIPNVPGLAITNTVAENNQEHAAMDDAAGMGQLVLGIRVPSSVESAPQFLRDPTCPYHGLESRSTEVLFFPQALIYRVDQIRQFAGFVENCNYPWLIELRLQSLCVRREQNDRQPGHHLVKTGGGLQAVHHWHGNVQNS